MIEDDEGCICRGNWRAIVRETTPLLDKLFKDRAGKLWYLYGIVHGEDDYYYGMSYHKEGRHILLTCVGSLQAHGFTLAEEYKYYEDRYSRQ